MNTCQCETGKASNGQAHAGWCPGPIISKPIENRDTVRVERELPKSELYITRSVTITWPQWESGLLDETDKGTESRTWYFDSSKWDDSAILIRILTMFNPGENYTVEFKSIMGDAAGSVPSVLY